MRHIVSLVVWIAVSATAGVVGGIASINAATFYSLLERPSWAPPPWLFGPVWTLLYLLMGITAWLVWRRRDARTSLALFLAQLAANALWSWLFFAWHRGAWVFADIIALLVLVAATAVAFARVRPAAGVCMVPYFAWVAFAGALTWWVWRANPALLGT
jgi:translocator protein